MDKTVACLLGALGTLAAVAPTDAAPLQPTHDTLLQAQSYGDILRPVPNAAAILAAMDAAQPAPEVTEVQYYIRRGNDHHHHHHRRVVRRRVEHHHHHHHDNVVIRR